MIIKSFGSSSKGNSILVNNNLLLDAGISPKNIFPKPYVVLISHAHGDHAKYAKEWAKRSADIFTPERLTTSHREVVVNEHEWVACGGYNIYPFPSIHDVKCFGYLIDFPTGERLCYNIDSRANIYKMQGITHYITECNYDDESLEKSNYAPYLKQRIIETHKSLATLLQELDDMDKSNLQEIYIAHLSDSNSNEKLIKEQVQKHTGILTTIL